MDMENQVEIKQEVEQLDTVLIKSEKADSNYGVQCDRIKTDHIEETWDGEILSKAVDQIKKEQHPAVAVKCENSQEEPDMNIIKTENINTSELNEELDIKPDDDPAPSTDSASAVKSRTVWQEKRQVHRKSEEAFICHNCDYKFLCKFDLMRHIARNCDSKIGGNRKNAFYGNILKRWSVISSAITDSKLDLDPAPCCSVIACQHCRSTFKCEQIRDEHIIKEHPECVASIERKIHECSDCSFKTTCNRCFKKHLWIHSQGKLGTSKRCTATFQSKRFVDDHVVREHLEFFDSVSKKTHKCLSCTFKTTDRLYFDIHNMRMHKIFTGDFEICQHCDAAFRIKSSLDDHILKKHPDFAAPIFNRKIYECSNCKYKTVKKGLIKNHMFIHSKLKRFICRHCDAKFRHKASLENHIVKKHPEFIGSVNKRIYECSYCSCKTIYKTNFIKHIMSAHSGGQLNACQHCPAKFKNKMSLDDHVMKKHPDLIASVTSKIL